MAIRDRAHFIVVAPFLLAALSASTGRAAPRQGQQDAKITPVVTQITRYAKELAGKSDDAAREI